MPLYPQYLAASKQVDINVNDEASALQSHVKRTIMGLIARDGRVQAPRRAKSLTFHVFDVGASRANKTLTYE